MSVHPIFQAIFNDHFPSLPRITVEPRLPNERLWELHRKSIARTATAAELDELEGMLERMEVEPSPGDAFGPGSRASRRANLCCPAPSGFDPYRKGES